MKDWHKILIVTPWTGWMFWFVVNFEYAGQIIERTENAGVFLFLFYFFLYNLPQKSKYFIKSEHLETKYDFMFWIFCEKLDLNRLIKNSDTYFSL